MRNIPFILFFVCLTNNVFADTLTINRKLEDLEFRLKRIEGNEQNYKLEKDLLKETYSNNYERINFFITIALGLIGILGFLGIRDISSIKKEKAYLNGFARKKIGHNGQFFSHLDGIRAELQQMSFFTIRYHSAMLTIFLVPSIYDRYDGKLVEIYFKGILLYRE